MTGRPGANHGPAAELPPGGKVGFLSRPEAYPESTRRVELVETHMSWVFLTDTRAYKMKKPVRYAFLDYSTLERRRRMCGEELRLNRRLASWVYLGVVALVCDDRGRLALGEPGNPPPGTIVEWLVKMVRLPAERLLDEAIRHEAVNEPDAERAAAHLAGFLARAEPVRPSVAVHIRRLGTAIDANARDIDAAGTPGRRYASVVRALHDFLDESHTISQDLPSREGSFWHAVMHRREPDAWNSKYWWRKVGPHPVLDRLVAQAPGAGYEFTLPEEFVDFFATYYGPTLKALEAAGDAREALRSDLIELAREWNRLDDGAGAIAIPGEYLESVGRRV